MKKITKKILTSVLAAAMVLGMSVTALAADAVSVSDTADKVTKTWTAAENGMLNDAECFSFKLAYKGAEQIGTNDTAAPQYQNADFSEKTETVTTAWKTQANGGTSASASINYTQLFGGITFSAPGLYSFTLAETAGTNPNVSYSTDSYIIDVQVVWSGDTPGTTLEVKSITTYETVNGEKDKKVSGDDNKGATFTNGAADSSSLTVSKTVKGNAANTDDAFTFTIMVTGIDGTYTTSDSDKTLVAADGTGTVEVTLKHGQEFTIHNLPVGADYTVVEGANDYDTKEYVVTAGTTAGTRTKGQTAEGEIAEGTNAVAFTNTKNVNAPTGVFMDIIPFIVLIGAVLIGCAAFFAFRRRRSF